MLSIVQNYWFWILVGAGWLFSSAVDTMPEVHPGSGWLYAWLYRFLHLIVANAQSAFQVAERARQDKP